MTRRRTNLLETAIPDETDIVAYTIFLLDSVRECYERCSERIIHAQQWLDLLRAVPRTNIAGRTSLSAYSLWQTQCEWATVRDAHNAFERVVASTPLCPTPREAARMTSATISLWCAALENDTQRLLFHAKHINHLIDTDADAPWRDLENIMEDIAHPMGARGHLAGTADATTISILLGHVEREFSLRYAVKARSIRIHLEKLRS